MILRTATAALFVALAVTTAGAQEADDEPPGPFRKLFVTLARDIKDLPSRNNVTFLVNGALLAAAAYPLDDLATLGASSSPVLKATFAGAGKALGREWMQGGGALAAYVAGHVWDKPRMVAASGDLIEAQLVAVTVTQGLKFAFSRTRPDGEARSFPSGHASAAFATARVMQRHFGPKVAVPAYAIAVYTAASRLQANSHYASDVFFGAALGLAIANTATAELEQSRFQISPSVVPGGVAFFVVAR
jgi:membrane-associated phospholipid phosphatase